MNRTYRFILFLFALSLLAGYLLSKASFVGRAGISLFYQQYSFLKIWWQAGFLVFAVWMLLFFLQRWAVGKLTLSSLRIAYTGGIVFGLVGLYFTYQDFRHSLAHRWLGERFHLGAYLFWIGWILIGVFYLVQKSKPDPTLASSTDVQQLPSN